MFPSSSSSLSPNRYNNLMANANDDDNMLDYTPDEEDHQSVAESSLHLGTSPTAGVIQPRSGEQPR